MHLAKKKVMDILTVPTGSATKEEIVSPFRMSFIKMRTDLWAAEHLISENRFALRLFSRLDSRPLVLFQLFFFL